MSLFCRLARTVANHWRRFATVQKGLRMTVTSAIMHIKISPNCHGYIANFCTCVPKGDMILDCACSERKTHSSSAYSIQPLYPMTSLSLNPLSLNTPKLNPSGRWICGLPAVSCLAASQINPFLTIYLMSPWLPLLCLGHINLGSVTSFSLHI